MERAGQVSLTAAQSFIVTSTSHSKVSFRHCYKNKLKLASKVSKRFRLAFTCSFLVILKRVSVNTSFCKPAALRNAQIEDVLFINQMIVLLT